MLHTRQRTEAKRIDFIDQTLGIRFLSLISYLHLIQQGRKQVHEQNRQPDPFGKGRVEDPDQHRQGTDPETVDPPGSLHVGCRNRVGGHVGECEHAAADQQVIERVQGKIRRRGFRGHQVQQPPVHSSPRTQPKMIR